MPIRYLFCINPGRSGSDYLAGLLARARNAVGVHEDRHHVAGAGIVVRERG